MAVSWSQRGRLECLTTKAEVQANAIGRIEVTAARQWLGTGSRSPASMVCLGRRASVEKSVFESPMFRQIHPTVVLIVPAAVPRLADDRPRLGDSLPAANRAIRGRHAEPWRLS